MNQRPLIQKGTRGYYVRQYASSRTNLLIMIALTVISCVTLLTGDVYFMFSAYLPIMCTNLIELFVMERATSYMPQVIDILIAAMVVVAVVSLIVYLLCWIFSKKHVGWLIAALVFFAIDSVVLLLDMVGVGFSTDMILDVLFHAYVMYYLVSGVVAGIKLRTMPVEPVMEIEPIPSAEEIATNMIEK